MVGSTSSSPASWKPSSSVSTSWKAASSSGMVGSTLTACSAVPVWEYRYSTPRSSPARRETRETSGQEEEGTSEGTSERLRTSVLPRGCVVLNQTRAKHPLTELVERVLQVTTV